tara:strand:+ start:36254 stop:39640 length:3387 start_codon:yes stop_codon:yes gene_type:complete
MANNDLGQQLTIATQLSDMLKTIPGLLNNIGGSAGSQADAMQQLANSANDIDSQRIDSMTDALEAMAKGAEKAGNQSAGMGKKLTKAAGAGMIAKSAFQGFTSGLSGMFSVVGGLIKSLMNLGSFIVGGLMKSWGALVSGAMDLRNAGDAAAKAWEKVRGEFGSLASNEGKAIVSSFKQIRSAGGFAAKTGKSLMNVFGGEFTAGLTALTDIAKTFGDTFSQMRDQFVGSATELLILNKGLNLSGEALLSLAQHGRAAGQTMQESLEETTVLVMGMEKQIGVDGKQIGKNLDKLAKDMSNFGHMSKKQLVATAGYAAKLGVSIEGMGAMFDKFENFEDAATGAAKLAEAFGMNVDAMAMMNAESPGEQMDMMRNAFSETGKSLDDLSRSERKYFEDLTGLKGADLYNAFDPSNADISFDDMMDAADEAEAQMDPAEAMIKAADKMEKAIDRMHKKSQGFFDSFSQGFTKGMTHVMMSSGVFKGLTKALDDVYKIGYNVAQAIFGEPDGFFSKKNKGNIDKFNNAMKAVVDFFKGFGKAITNFAKGGGEDFNTFFKDMRSNLMNFLKDERVDQFGGMLLQFIGQGLKVVMKGMAGLFSMITGTVEGGAANAFGDLGLGPAMTEGIAKMGDSLSEGGSALWSSFKGLLTSLGNNIIEWAGTEEGKEIITKMLLIMAGPGVLKGAFAGIGQYIVLSIPAMFAAAKAAIIASGATTFGSALSAVFMAVATKILGFFGMAATGGVAIITAKVALVIAAVISTIQSLFQVFKRAGARFFDEGTSMTEAIVGMMIDSIMFLPRVFVNIINWIGNFLGFEKDALLNGFDDLSDWLISWATYIVSGIGSALGSIIDVILWPFKKAWGAVKSFFGISSPSKAAADMGQNIVEGIMGSLGSLAGVITAPFKAAWSAATAAWDGAKEWASKKAEQIKEGFNKVKDIAKSGWETAKGWGSSFAGALGINSPSKLMSKFAGHVNDGFNKAIDFSSGAAKAAGAMMPIGSGIADSISTGLESIPSMLSQAMPNLDQHLAAAKQKVSDSVGIVANTIGSIKTHLAEMAPINAEMMVARVADGLAGKNAVKVNLSDTSIKVNITVSIDAVDLASALSGEQLTKSEKGKYFEPLTSPAIQSAEQGS